MLFSLNFPGNFAALHSAHVPVWISRGAQSIRFACPLAEGRL